MNGNYSDMMYQCDEAYRNVSTIVKFAVNMKHVVDTHCLIIEAKVHRNFTFLFFSATGRQALDVWNGKLLSVCTGQPLAFHLIHL